MSTIDDLFEEIGAIKEFEPETKPLDVNSLFGDIDDTFPTQERLESQEYLKASEEEAEFERQQVPSGLETLAERGDIFAPQADPEVEIQDPLEFTPEAITPSKDESNVLKRVGSGLADIKAGGFSLGEKVSIPTASGISEGDPQYRSAVKAENTRGKDVLSAIGKVKNNVFSHKDFEFIGTVPTKQSLQPVEDALKEMGKSDAEVKEDLDSVRSYIMRSEQFRRGMEKEHWNKVAEGLYSTDEQIHDIYDRLNFVVNKLPSSGKADEEVLKGFFEGTLEHDISSMIGWAAATNPKRAAKLAREFENVKREIDENSIDHGKAVNFAKEVAKIIGPMSKTMAKGAVAGAVPGVGTMLAPTVMAPDWMSAEAGGIFEESIREGVAPEDAAGNAILFGIASGLVEQLQVGRLKDLVSAFGKDRFKGLLKEGVQNFIKKRGVKAAQKLAKNFAVQTSQEGVQKAITTIAKETNVADAGLSEKEFSDILMDGWEGLKTEMIETAPHMAALTAISGLTGLSLGKARRIMNPRINRSIQSALAEQELEYTPENVAQVLAEDPELQARIDENTTLVDQIESARNRSLVAKVGQKKTSPAEIQRIWKTEYNSPISHATAQEKAEILEILQARAEQVGISSQLREETSKKFDEQYEQALAKTEATAQRLRDLKNNLPLMLEDKRTESEEFNALDEVKKSIQADGVEITKKNVIKYWRNITGDKLNREEASSVIKIFENMESRDAEEDRRVTEEVSPEEAIEPSPDEEVRVRDDEQVVEEPEVTGTEAVTEDGIPIIDEIPQEVLDDILGGKAVEAVSEEVDNVQMLNEVFERNKESVSKDELFKIVSELDPKTQEDWTALEETLLESDEVVAEAKESLDYVLENEEGVYSLSSDFKSLSSEEKVSVLKEIKDDINVLMSDKDTTKDDRASLKAFIDDVDVDTEIAEELFLTKEGEEQVTEEQTLFSISKDGQTVRPSIDELHIFEKATKDIEYFIPPELLDKMELEFVDGIVHNGEKVEGADGAIVMTPDGGLKVMIHKDTPLDQQAKLLYHEIMGHAGVSNVINNDSKLHKEAVRLFNSSEAQEKVNELRTRYKDVLAKTKEQFGEDVANDTLFSEWMAHEMHEYMLNRDEQSVGARLWNLFKDWLVSKGWVKAENAEEFMRVLTKEMRKVPPSKISTDFNVKYKGPAMAFSLKDRVAGAKKKQKTIAKKETAKKEAPKKELTTKKVSPEKKASKKRKSPKPIKEALKDVVAKERAKKKEAVSKVREKAKETVKKVKKEAQEKIAQEKTQKQEAVAKVKEEKKELTQKQREQVKALKEKHKQELKNLRTKINKQHNDREVKIEEFHDSILEYAEKYFVTEKESKSKDGTIKIVRTVDSKSLNELKAYLFRIRPKTAKGLIGAKNRSLKKLAGMVEKKKIKEVKSELIKTIKSMPKEMTTAEKEAFNGIIENIQLSNLSKNKKLFLNAVQHLKDNGVEPSPELNEELVRLKKIAIEELDVEDMISMVISLKEVIHESVIRQKTFIKDRLIDYEKAREEVESEIAEGRDLIERSRGATPTKDIAKKENAMYKVGEFLWGNLALTPDAIISERISNVENGKLEEMVTGEMDNALTNLLRFMHDIDKKMETQLGGDYSKFKNMSSLFYSNKNNRKILKNIGLEVELPDGRKVDMTPAQRISFILHSRNEHNRKSVLKDGVLFDTNLGDSATVLKLKDEDLDAIVKSATPLENKIADFFHSILNNESREALLETSKSLQGYEMEVVDDYYPLHRHDLYRDYLTKGMSQNDLKSQVRTFLENTGSLKARQKNASGVVVIEDAFKTFYDSIKLTGGYKAYAKPLRTAKKIVGDLRTETSRKYGLKKELDALSRYIDDIEGSIQVRRDAFETKAKKVFGRAAQSVLGLNPVVIMRQIPSFLTIGTTGIDSKHMVKGLNMVPFAEESKRISRKIEKYSPQIWQRITKGTVNAELGDRANVNEASRFFGKSKDIFEWQTIGIEAADAGVMRRIFKASESEISEKHPTLSGDAKWEKIAERAEYIVKETQPVYAREHRSELGRSRSLMTRSFLAFTSVTNQLLKSYVKAVGRYRREPNKTKAKLRIAEDLFWINISATIAMTGVDELRDKVFGKTSTKKEMLGRGIRYAMAPFYLSGIPSSFIQDYLKFTETGKFEGWQSEMARGNLISGILTDLVSGAGDIISSINHEDWKFDDWNRLVGGSTRVADALLKTTTGASFRNLVNYFIRPWTIDRGNPEVITISKGLGYKPFIPRSKTIGRVKYRMMKDAYKDKMKAVHQYVQDAIDRTPDFDEKSDEDKERFLKREYKTANRSHGGFDMSDMVRIEEDK